MPPTSLLRRLFGPLRSRKVRVALVTVAAAFAAQFGLNVPSELLLAIVGMGASLVLGIAHEDAGRNAAHLLQTTAPQAPGAEKRP